MATTSKEKASTEGKKAVSLPFGIKFSYGIGDIASNIFIVGTGMYLLFFMTNVLGINPALAGTMLLWPKLWDVISDPMMGAISDITRSRFGRRRPCTAGGPCSSHSPSTSCSIPRNGPRPSRRPGYSRDGLRRPRLYSKLNLETSSSMGTG